jgi:hypothetical protein
MGLGKISKGSKAGMVRLADYNMVKHFDFQKLTCPD